VTYFVQEPAVDVVIVNWNYGGFVASAIQSVKDQSYKQFRCIVIDNGSADDSLDRITEAIGNHPQFIVHRLPTNLGHLGAALWSFKHLTSEFVTFLDADDVLFPNYLASHLQAHLAAEYSVGFTSSNCLDVNADGALLTSGNSNMYNCWQRGTTALRQIPTALRPMKRTVRLAGVDDEAYSMLAEAARYLPAPFHHWCWCPGSSNMFRRALLERVRPIGPSPVLFGGVDGFFLPILHALTGTILIDLPLSAYRLHADNDYSTLPSLQGVLSAHPKAEAQSFDSYRRMLTWVLDQLDVVLLMAGPNRYWQVLASAASTDPRVRDVFAHREIQLTLARHYRRLVEVFGEFRVFHELRRYLSFSEYTKIVVAACGRALPIAEIGRAFSFETVRNSRRLYTKLRGKK
jgi:glycosyltransferase involved in cell wall biosynthesis